MTQQKLDDEQKRRGADLAEFFANRPKVTGRALERAVRMSKILLPLLAVGLLTLVIAWPYLSKQESSVTLSYRDLRKSGEEIRMVEPRYLGTDSRNRRFEVAAAEAVQNGINAKEVMLDGVHASLRLDSGDDVTAAAVKGIYRPDDKRLELDQGIRLQAGGGYSFESDHLILDLGKGEMQGGGDVAGAAPFGTFSAEKFSADVTGQSMALDGKVRVRLDPGYQDTGKSPETSKGPEIGKGETTE